MAANLKTSYTADGTPLNGVYAYNDHENNVAAYGRLYTWQSALDAAPSGWHLPTDEEWNVLEAELGSEPATKLKVGGSSGFNARLAGYRGYEGGYEAIDYWGQYWSSTPYTDDHSFVRNIFSDRSDIVRSGYGNAGAISVRYIKD